MLVPPPGGRERSHTVHPVRSRCGCTGPVTWDLGHPDGPFAVVARHVSTRCVDRGPGYLLADVDLGIPRGAVTVLTGPACGPLLRCLSGQDRPDVGVVCLDDTPTPVSPRAVYAALAATTFSPPGVSPLPWAAGAARATEPEVYVHARSGTAYVAFPERASRGWSVMTAARHLVDRFGVTVVVASDDELVGSMADHLVFTRDARVVEVLHHPTTEAVVAVHTLLGTRPVPSHTTTPAPARGPG